VYTQGLVVLGVWALGAGGLPAAEPQLRGLFPMGVSRTGTIEVTLSGSDLKDARQLVFSLPGLTAERRGENRFAVTADGSLPEQEGEVWALTPAGLSNPVRVSVGDLPLVIEHEPNDGAATAQQVALPVIVDGAINPATDRDEYRFEVEAGQRVSMAFRSESLGGSVRPALTLFDPGGRERLHDPGGPAEPVLDFQATEGGGYRLRVEDRAYRRDEFSTYRLGLFTGPRLVAAFPAVLMRGKPQPVVLFGYELPGGRAAGAGFPPGLERLDATIDAPAAGAPDGGGWTSASGLMLDGFPYQHPAVRGSMRLGLVDGEITAETEGRHDTLATAQEVPVATVIAGRFLRPAEVDWYRFTAKKGEALWIEGVGERAGLVMDLDVAIHDLKGKMLQTLGDTAQPKAVASQLPLETLDPMGAWTAPADGAYALVVRDLYGPVAWGVDRSYQLRLGPLRDEARVVVLPPRVDRPCGISVPQGGQVDLLLTAVRRGGSPAPITVHAEGLPPGLEAKPTTIPADQSTKTMTLSATTDAPVWAGLFALRAETQRDGVSRGVPVLAATVVRPGKPSAFRLCAALAAAITGGAAAAPALPSRAQGDLP
jgi:hypothetical protein